MPSTITAPLPVIPEYDTQLALLLNKLLPLQEYLGITQQDLYLLALETLLQHCEEAAALLASLQDQGSDIRYLRREPHPARSPVDRFARGRSPASRVKPIRRLTDLLD